MHWHAASGPQPAVGKCALQERARVYECGLCWAIACVCICGFCTKLVLELVNGHVFCMHTACPCGVTLGVQVRLVVCYNYNISTVILLIYSHIFQTSNLRAALLLLRQTISAIHFAPKVTHLGEIIPSFHLLFV